jgi:outer membrane protein, heavy metal efflux system
MKQTISIFALLFLGINLFAQQSVDNVLAEIEKNNLTLAAYRKSAEAEKILNKTSLTLKNPEVDYGYYWGNPTVIGNRTDFSIRQSFDFPTVYRYKSQISEIRNEQTDLLFAKKREEVLYESRLVCVQLIHQNALISATQRRYDIAKQLAEAYRLKYAKGEINVIEYNKAQLNLAQIARELDVLRAVRIVMQAELTGLNGGVQIDIVDDQYPIDTVPGDFDLWFRSVSDLSPCLLWINREIDANAKLVQLNSALSLPRFYAGYASEKVVGQHFQGVQVGVTIPLWENKNTIRYARAQQLAAQDRLTEARNEMYHALKASYDQISLLDASLQEFRAMLAAYNHEDLLKVALEMGEISLTEFLTESALSYERTIMLLELEKQLYTAKVGLRRCLP